MVMGFVVGVIGVVVGVIGVVMGVMSDGVHLYLITSLSRL